jgi:hypothetical protein
MYLIGGCQSCLVAPSEPGVSAVFEAVDYRSSCRLYPSRASTLSGHCGTLREATRDVANRRVVLTMQYFRSVPAKMLRTFVLISRRAVAQAAKPR